MNKSELELQAVTDLVAFQVMTKVFLHQVAEEADEQKDIDLIASHQSDDGTAKLLAEHQSDVEVPTKYWGLRLPLAWKLARLWRQYKWRIEDGHP